MIDTLKTIPSKTVVDSTTTFETHIVLDTLRLPSNQSLDLITKVDTFYNNAWTKLIVTITLLFIIVGILVPLIIQWYQKKQLKLSEDTLRAEIQSEYEKSLITSKQEIREELAKTLADIQKNNNDNINELEKKYQLNIDKLKRKSENLSMVFTSYLMSKISSNNGEYNNAIYAAFNGLSISVKDGKSGNTTSLFKRIKKDITHTTKVSLDAYLKKKNTTYDKLLDKVAVRDKDDSNKIDIDELREMYLKLNE